MRFFIVLLLATLCYSQKEQTSVFSSIFETLSSSDISPECPGRCFNALASLACQEVLDDPRLCPKSGFRCCKNVAEKEPEPKPQSTIEEKPQELDEDAGSQVSETTEQIESATENTISTETQIAEERMDSPQQYSAPATVKVCPGVCVAERISNFCEAVIDVHGLCKVQLRCCVPANLFDGVDNPPKEFLILNPTGEDKDKSPKVTTTTSLGKVSTTTVNTDVEAERQMTTRRSDISESSAKVDDNGIKDDDGIPPEKQCKGTCVAGFFAFLCDSIDRTGECPRGGRCCVTQRKRPKPGAEVNDEPSPSSLIPQRTSPKPTIPLPLTTKAVTATTPRTTTTTATRRTTTKPTTKRTITTTTTTTMTPEAPPCFGTCYPVSVASRCKSPSRLVVASGCQEDEICCNDFGKSPEAVRPQRPSSQMPQALGTLLSLFGGGSNDQKPPPPPRRTTIPPRVTTTTPIPTTTTPQPTTVVTERPDCPGTCIAPLLSFTCFGNAEMTDIFKCSKGKQSCCSPKSAITEFTRQYEMHNNIARNDTVYPGFNPYEDGNFGPPGFNPYEHAQYVQNSYDQGNFAPPPPPPYNHRNEENYQQTYYQSQEQPTQYQSHHYEQPQYVERPSEHYSPHYNVQPPQEHMAVPQHSTYYETPEESTPYYQASPPPPPPPSHVQPNYEQEPNLRQSYPPPPHQPAPDSSSVPSNIPFLTGKPPVDNKYVCGVKGANRAARVVGGEDAVPGEWCWQVALINSLNQYLCGGALIGTQWVLTAAHCVTNIVRSGDAIYVRVGDHDLTTRFGSPGAQTLPVATTYIHHNHNSQTLDNDIALLKLSSHAELGNGVCLSCLPARGVSQNAGKRCTVTGYGYMGETGPIPLRVREAEIPVVSDNECVRKINAVTEKIFILPASSFCAGGESGHDACQGDGGGPLVCDVDGYYELSGLVSWGFGCGRQDVPGVYVKVASFIGWVNQIISVNNL